MPDRTILVVEDEFGTAEVLQLMLELEGYRVILAANGSDALTRVSALRPDLVLTDYMMPVMSGAQLGHALRRDPATAQVPIVMMSGVHEGEVRRDFDQYDAFLPKPYRLDQLLGLVREQFAAPGRGAPGARPRGGDGDSDRAERRIFAALRWHWSPAH